MKTLHIVIFVCCILAVIGVCLVVYYCALSVNTNIGNLLSDYVYNRHSGLHYKSGAYSSNPAVNEFFKNVVNNDSDLVIENNFAKNTSVSNKWHSGGRQDFLLFWKNIRKHLSEVYNKSVPDKYKHVEYPVVHFRCSDIPFIRHPDYHLPKISTVRWIIELLKKRGYAKVIWLNCKIHSPVVKIETVVCDDINSIYIEEFKKEGIDVVLQCEDILTDFYTMIYSPLLVSLNPSSFSFMAGISKDPDNYVSCNMGSETNGKYTLQKKDDADWHQSINEPILHVNVKNYNDIKEIRHHIYNS